MPRLTNTRSKILALAQRFLQHRGFHGFSYRHLAEALGVKTAAIHYHFKTKGELGIELVSHIRRWFQQWAADADSSIASPKARLDAFYEMHAKFLDKESASPYGVLEAEYTTLPDSMRGEVRALASEIHGWIARTLRQGADARDLSFRGDADDQALAVGAAVQGALLISRAFGERGWGYSRVSPL